MSSIDQEKLISFLKEPNLRKFCLDDKTVFKDGRIMNRFYKTYSKEIEKMAMQGDDVCIGIMHQYQEYLELMKKSRARMFEITLKLFVAEPDLNKFDSKMCIQFSNGTSMASFWAINANTIGKLDTSDAKLAVEQYKKYMTIKVNKTVLARKSSPKPVKRKPSFKRLPEFYEIDDLDKFLANSSITFKDGKLAYRWWSDNKKYVLESNNPACLAVKEQFKEYELRKQVIKEERFMLRLIEFEGADCMKFAPKSNCKFSDGTSMSRWWADNKHRVFDMSDEIACHIVYQYDLLEEQRLTRKYCDELYNASKRRKQKK